MNDHTGAGGQGSQQEWNADLYDTRHAFVWQYGTDLLELLAPQSGERILDLGCGTGHLTTQIAASGAEVIGLDRAPTMIAQARKNYPHLSFVIADGASFSFAEPFDAVFSNAALHWMRPPTQVVACIRRALKSGGRLVAEFGGKGNIQTIRNGVQRVLTLAGYPLPAASPWYFPSIGEYSSLLEAHGFTVTYAALFDRPTALAAGAEGLRNWLAMFAHDLLADIPAEQHSALIQQIEQQLQPTLSRNGTWFADYKRLRVVALTH